MSYIIAKIILKIWGWKIKGSIPHDIKKCVIIEAPHTSNCDFIIGRFAFFLLKLNVKFLIKKEIFIFPLGYIIKAFGGIPVDRKKNTNIINYISGLFNQHDSLYIVITPEGTRKRNPKWKKGFYYIAQRANLPIALGFIDYAKKEGGIGKIIKPSGDFEKDFKIIQEFYKDKTAKHPEKFNLTK
ncbi:MAG: 1-acyl-sn-glycerol-3-phosphate acyltransferase [Bacteroidales bacterium]|nr:1-acyl-sn-glycerol-3-phosphate acyltransferase [Bacteroidales bacterium]